MRVSRVFEPVAAEVQNARTFVASQLEAWMLQPGYAVLLVSELATNAVLHARSDFCVTVIHDGDRLRVELSDENSRLPSFVVVPEDANSGRGLLLVQALAGAWGVESKPDGKVIWFEVSTKP